MKYPKQFFYQPIVEFITHMFYPNRCMFCDKCIEFNEFVCDNCYKKMEEYKIDFCTICKESPCNCSSQEHIFDYIEGVFVYADFAKKAILSLKYADNVCVSSPMAFYMYLKLKEKKLLKTFDLIIPVPSTKSKRRKRGYNQAELLATELSKFTKKDCDCKSFLKIKKTKEQHTLSAQERQYNLKGCFLVAKPDNIQNKNILLVDDVSTTGATFKECCQTLLNAGANSVKCISFTCTQALKE